MSTLCLPVPLYGTAAEIRRRLLGLLKSVADLGADPRADSVALRVCADLQRWVTDEEAVRDALVEEAGRHLAVDPWNGECEVPGGLAVTIDIERDQSLPVSLHAVLCHPRGDLRLRFHLARIAEPVLPADSWRAVYRVEET